MHSPNSSARIRRLQHDEHDVSDNFDMNEYDPHLRHMTRSNVRCACIIPYVLLRPLGSIDLHLIPVAFGRIVYILILDSSPLYTLIMTGMISEIEISAMAVTD